MAVTSWANPIAPGAPIRAVDLTELRTAVAASRTVAGLAVFAWTDQPLVAGMTNVKAVHFTELRQAILDLWQHRDPGCQLPPWTATGPGGTGPIAGGTIYAQDLLDLRAWLNQYEDPSL